MDFDAFVYCNVLSFSPIVYSVPEQGIYHPFCHTCKVDSAFYFAICLPLDISTK